MNSQPQDQVPQNSLLPLRRWELAALLIILLAGAAVRISYLSELAREPAFLTPGKDQVDMAFYDDYARRLTQRARGALGLPAPVPDPYAAKLVAPWKQGDDEAFVRPPGYTFFVAFSYLVTGDSPVGLRAVQMAMGMASALLGWWLARRLLGRVGGLLFAAFMCGYWTLIVYEGEIHSPVLMIFLSLLALHALLRWQRAPGMARAAVVGLVLGAYVLTAPAILLFIPVAAGWMAVVARPRSRPALRALLQSWVALALAFGGAILPCAVSNYLADGSIQLSAAGFGTVLLYGNHEGADGTFHIPKNVFPFPTTEDHAANMREVEKYLGRKPAYSEMSRYAGEKALEYIMGHPRRFAELTLKRCLLFWGPCEISHNVMEYCTWRFSPTLRRLPGDFKTLVALAVAGLAFFAAALLRRRRCPSGGEEGAPSGNILGMGLVLLLMLTWFGPYSIFYITTHYRVPVLPFLGLFAVYGLVSLGWAFQAGRWKSMACVLPGVLVYAASLMVPMSYEKDVDRWYYFRITPKAERGDLDGALRASTRVVEGGICSSRAWVHHGDLLRQAGRTREALAALDAALRCGPLPEHLAETWARIGVARSETGDKTGAEQAFRNALGADAANFEALSCLARLVLDRGNTQEAVELLERAAAAQPDKSNPLFMLGLVRRQMGQEDAAEAAFRKGMSTDPGDVWPVMGLANLLEARGRLEEARAAYQKALEIDPANAQAREGAARTGAPG